MRRKELRDNVDLMLSSISAELDFQVDEFVDIDSEEDYQFLLARLDDITKHNHNTDLRILSAEPA